MHISEISVKNPVFVNLIMASIIIIGMFVAWNLPLELFPSVQMELVLIQVPYPGASPEDIEQLVTIPIEDEIADLKGVKLVRSTSAEGLATIVAEIYPGEDVKKLAQDIRSEVAKIRDRLPDDIESPIIQEIEAEIPVINVAIAGDVPRAVLRNYALRVRDEIKKIDGVGTVLTSGMGAPVFWVRLDPIALQQYNIDIQNIVRVIRDRNLDVPGGSFEQGPTEFLVRTRGRIHSVEELQKIPIRTSANGRLVFLRDVALIELGEEEAVTLNRVNGHPAISFWINKRKNVDTIETADTIKEKVQELNRRLPEKIRLYVTNDTSYWVKHRFQTMLKSGITGLIAVLILLSVFLDLRAAAMAALGLPVSFLGAFILMHLTGLTLNVLTMFSLILVLGIIVDDAIIVAENIQRYVQLGYSPKEAAIKGTKEVTNPVLATVLTNIASFIPLIMASGLIGKFLSIIPKVAIYAFAVSLLEALLILPSHCADFLKPTDMKKGRKRQWFYRLRHRYLQILAFALRHRYAVVAGFLFILIVTSAVLSKLPFLLFYMRDIAQFQVRIETSPSSDILETARVVQQVEAFIRENVPSHVLKNVVSMVGVDMNNRRPVIGDNLATIFVEYVDFENRKENGIEIMNELRRKIVHIPFSARIEFLRQEGPPTGKPVDVRILGNDFRVLKRIVGQAKEFLRKIPGVYAVTDDLQWGKPELKIEVDEALASMYGLSTRQVATIVRTAVDGLTVTRTRVGKEETDIVLKYNLPPGDVKMLLLSARIPTPYGRWVPLARLVHMTVKPGLLKISRYDEQRAVRVMAEIDQNVTTPREVNRKLGLFLTSALKNYPGYSFAFGGEEQETRESVKSIIEAGGIAIILIYSILATILRSYTQPFIIMTIVPFSVIGVAIGILLRGEPFSMPALIGTVALLGVVVNDSLVLMDFINTRRAKLPRITAVFYSAKHRFRPVILTTVTTFAGLASLMTKTRGEAAYLAPMAIALGFGLLFATLITLLLIPCLYLILDDIFIFIRSRVFHRSVTPAPTPVQSSSAKS